MSTDYLAKIAARTVECPCYIEELCKGCQDVKGRGYPTKTASPYCPEFCDHCKGSGRVLDPRFEGLREWHKNGHAVRGNDLSRVWVIETCFARGCPGYSTNRDLAVLLEYTSSNHAVSLYNMPSGGWACNVFGLHGEADTPIEAAAKAVWEWLEVQEKVAS